MVGSYLFDACMFLHIVPIHVLKKTPAVHYIVIIACFNCIFNALGPVMNLLIIAIAVLIIVNIYVSFSVSRCDFLEVFQKIAQTIIIWLVPIIGAIIIFAFISSYYKPSPFRDRGDDQHHDGTPHEAP